VPVRPPQIVPWSGNPLMFCAVHVCTRAVLRERDDCRFDGSGPPPQATTASTRERRTHAIGDARVCTVRFDLVMQLSNAEIRV
jgi:hypothetical protein